MAKIKIEFTEDIIKLVKNLRFGPIESKYYVTPSHDDVVVEDVGSGRFNVISVSDEGLAKEIAPIRVTNIQDLGDNLYGIDNYNLWGGTYIYEDMAYILGKMDKVVKGTEEDPDGPKFEEETAKYLEELASFIIENLSNIEEILHQFCTEGIHTGVTYVCKPNEHIWSKEEK